MKLENKVDSRLQFSSASNFVNIRLQAIPAPYTYSGSASKDEANGSRPRSGPRNYTVPGFHAIHMQWLIVAIVIASAV